MDITYEESSYAGLNIIVFKGGKIWVEDLLKQRVKQLKSLTINEFLRKHKRQILKKTTSKQEASMMFPAKGYVDLKEWDISLYCYILIEFCDLGPIPKSYLEELNNIKYELDHIPEAGLDHCKYTAMLTEVKTTFLNIQSLIEDKRRALTLKKLVDTFENISLSNNMNYYARINLVLVNGGTLLARMMFLQCVSDLIAKRKALTLEGFLSSNKTHILGTLTDKKYQNKIFPPNGSVNVEEWDLRLLCFILVEVCCLKGDYKLHIQQVKSMKNNLCCLPEPSISKQTFSKNSENIMTFFEIGIRFIREHGSIEEYLGQIVQKHLEHKNISLHKSVEVEALTDLPVTTSALTNRPISSTLADKLDQKRIRPPKQACGYDGRLILLSMTEKRDIQYACSKDNPIGRGGYGTVYKKWNKGFEMEIAIKQIKAQTMSKKNSARKEMVASRILHPFILPLLSTFELHSRKFSEFYFISPYCENGDLYRVLEECRKNPDTCRRRLNQTDRMRVALQIALAIQYLHTPVPNVREIIYHKDICS